MPNRERAQLYESQSGVRESHDTNAKINCALKILLAACRLSLLYAPILFAACVLSAPVLFEACRLLVISAPIVFAACPSLVFLPLSSLQCMCSLPCPHPICSKSFLGALCPYPFGNVSVPFCFCSVLFLGVLSIDGRLRHSVPQPKIRTPSVAVGRRRAHEPQPEM